MSLKLHFQLLTSQWRAFLQRMIAEWQNRSQQNHDGKSCKVPKACEHFCQFFTHTLHATLQVFLVSHEYLYKIDNRRKETVIKNTTLNIFQSIYRVYFTTKSSLEYSSAQVFRRQAAVTTRNCCAQFSHHIISTLQAHILVYFVCTLLTRWPTQCNA